MTDLLVVGAILLAGCGSASDDASDPDEATSSGDETVVAGDETATGDDTETDPASPPDDVAAWERPQPGPRAETRTGAFAVMERVEVRGPLVMEQARRVLQRGTAREMAACYRQGLERDADLEGTVVLLLPVQANGTVVSVDEDGGELADPDVQECIRGVAAGFVFPTVEGRASVKVWIRLTQTITSDPPPPVGGP